MAKDRPIPTENRVHLRFTKKEITVLQKACEEYDLSYAALIKGLLCVLLDKVDHKELGDLGNILNEGFVLVTNSGQLYNPVELQNYIVDSPDLVFKVGRVNSRPKVLFA